jgi:cytochrome c oxidase subunit 2
MQFEWHFRYHGPDGRFGTEDDVTSNGKLHVPVNTPVIVKLRTKDVLHSFWLPNARLKQDLLPGKEIPQWFELTETGTYEIACAELCGIGHTVMRGELVVESREEYEAWLKEQAELTGPHDPTDKALPWYWWPEGPRSE